MTYNIEKWFGNENKSNKKELMLHYSNKNNIEL